MKQFQNILFVSDITKEEVKALRHAIKLAEDNNTELNVLMVCPPLENSLAEYKNSYETFLLERMAQNIEKTKVDLNMLKPKSIKLDIEWGTTPDIRIIQRVIRNSYDLVVKAADTTSEHKGFRALDMALLRKCPCPVFLYHPTTSDEVKNIAVAVDPKSEKPEEHDLARKLLKLGQILSLHYKSNLHIISCWDCVLENYLRHSVLVDISPKELDDAVKSEGETYYSLLQVLIHEANIKKQPTIHYLKGSPTELIPSVIAEKKIDLLIMGTVARTGIPGFIIGNTAENILQKINCSLWAIKPQGFVSPVKAYE
ncbi:universal stress protein [Legionella cardiaca]|uniref:Universal stress protein n=1 Tax=Legionella cardiaca TaxID=1071983 RepID=A0ABY8AX02_9GAMM|nr:universal stress protein [Legionella cardiaca]WED44251.1 universal stress protein [Legionella cardiaca]